MAWDIPFFFCGKLGCQPATTKLPDFVNSGKFVIPSLIRLID
jgi:hypothetical protein